MSEIETNKTDDVEGHNKKRIPVDTDSQIENDDVEGHIKKIPSATDDDDVEGHIKKIPS